MNPIRIADPRRRRADGPAAGGAGGRGPGAWRWLPRWKPPAIRDWEKTPGRSPAEGRWACRWPKPRRRGRRGHRFLAARGAWIGSWGSASSERTALVDGHHRLLTTPRPPGSATAAERDRRALGTQHEPGGEPDDEARRGGRRGAGGQGRRRRDPRTAPPLQGRRPQRHGLEVRPDHRRRDGPDRRIATAAKAAPAGGPTARSATTPSASATIRASTRSSLPCSGETIELTVRATSRDCYAVGALAAAKFLAGRSRASTA